MPYEKLASYWIIGEYFDGLSMLMITSFSSVWIISIDNKLTDIPVPDKVDSPLVEDTKNVTVPKFVKRIRQNPVEFPGRKNKVQRVDQSGTNNKNVQLWWEYFENSVDEKHKSQIIGLKLFTENRTIILFLLWQDIFAGIINIARVCQHHSMGWQRWHIQADRSNRSSAALGCA